MPSHAVRHTLEWRYFITRRRRQRRQPRDRRAPRLRNLRALIGHGSLECFNLGFERALALPPQVFSVNPSRFFRFSNKFVGAPARPP